MEGFRIYVRIYEQREQRVNKANKFCTTRWFCYSLAVQHCSSLGWVNKFLNHHKGNSVQITQSKHLFLTLPITTHFLKANYVYVV